MTIDGATVVPPYRATRCGMPVIWAGVSGKGWFEVVRTAAYGGHGDWNDLGRLGLTQAQSEFILTRAREMMEEPK